MLGVARRRASVCALAAALLLNLGSLALAQGDAKKGEYLAKAGGCAGCHTETAAGAVAYAGGRVLDTPFGKFYGPNITPHPQAGIGKWGEQDFFGRCARGGARMALTTIRRFRIRRSRASATRTCATFGPLPRSLPANAINDAETGGFSRIDTGNWIPDNLIGALTKEDIKPEWYEYNLPKAKQLMAEAGFPNGFEVQQLSPLPNYFPLGERIITQLAEIGIKTKLNKMERAAFFDLLTKGVDALPGIIVNIGPERRRGRPHHRLRDL